MSTITYVFVGKNFKTFWVKKNKKTLSNNTTSLWSFDNSTWDIFMSSELFYHNSLGWAISNKVCLVSCC